MVLQEEWFRYFRMDIKDKWKEYLVRLLYCYLRENMGFIVVFLDYKIGKFF